MIPKEYYQVDIPKDGDLLVSPYDDVAVGVVLDINWFRTIVHVGDRRRRVSRMKRKILIDNGYKFVRKKND